jgi:hypothetical protein
MFLCSAENSLYGRGKYPGRAGSYTPGPDTLAEAAPAPAGLGGLSGFGLPPLL